MQSAITSVGQDVFIIDLIEEQPLRTGCWVVKGQKSVALVETGSTLANGYILEGLAKLAISRDEVSHVFLTHIHLDHSGGIGALIPHLPNAKVVCHPRAERHLLDPTKLIAGARSVYGDELETLFGEILPVPADRLITVQEDGLAIDLGERVLTCWDTPGHARHHICIYDEQSKGLFSGDILGCRHLAPGDENSPGFILASTSPSEFDIEATRSTLQKLQGMDIGRVYHTHFGMTEPASIAFEETLRSAEAMVKIAEEMFSPELTWQQLAKAVQQKYVEPELVKLGYQADAPLVGLQLDVNINCQGIVYALQKAAGK